MNKTNLSEKMLNDETGDGIHHEVCSRRKFLREDYIGKRFGRWEVIDYSGKAYVKNHFQFARMFLCKCDCGKISLVSLSNLTEGLTKGCKSCPLRKVNAVKNDPIRVLWYRINSRCVERWKNFNTFKHDVLPGRIDMLKKLGELNPTEKTKLGPYSIYFLRKNSMEKYSPQNCYWGTHKDMKHTWRHFSEGLTLAELGRETSYTIERLRQFSQENSNKIIEKCLLFYIIRTLTTPGGGKRRLYSKQAVPFLRKLRSIKGTKDREKFIMQVRSGLI